MRSVQVPLVALITYAMPVSPSHLSPIHHEEASALFEQALQMAQLAPTATEPVVNAAIDGLLHSGSVLSQAGHDEAALEAFNAVLRASQSPWSSRGSAASREHLLAMVQKLGALQRRFALLASETPAGTEKDTLGAARWVPALYWLDGVSQWEAQRGPVQRASGCTNALAAEAVQHLQQVSVDIEVRRVRDCFVGFHGILIRRDAGAQSSMHMLQLPSVPDSTAPLLTAWALGLLPADFQPRGRSWPFALPLAPNISPEDFTGANITRRATYYMQGLHLDPAMVERWPGFAALSRKELEAGMLWQSADELRHYENLTSTPEARDHDKFTETNVRGGKSSREQLCDGKAQVVFVEQLVNAICGYSLNYFHWMTELLPGLIRLRPLILADPNVRVLTHDVGWSRGVLLDILGIPEQQLLFEDGCSVYRASIVYTWSSDNPLSPQLLELSRQVLVPDGPTTMGAKQQGLPVCQCCNAAMATSAPQRRALVVDRRCKSDQTAAAEGRNRLKSEAEQCRASIRGRAIINHEEMVQAIGEELLEKDGWEVCSMAASECSVAEQMTCFASAELTVGIEGAGLTNALAMPRGATLVNLHPAHPESSFSTLVSACGQSYFWQLALASGLNYHAFMMPDFSFSGPSHRVDVDALRKFIATTINA